MKALEKDRTRRYGSPAELGADLERHLRDEPVLAGSPSTVYRVGKFVRRHRMGVTATAVIAVVLVVAVIGTGIGLLRAKREAENARQVSEFLVGIFEEINPEGSLTRGALRKRLPKVASPACCTGLNPTLCSPGAG